MQQITSRCYNNTGYFLRLPFLCLATSLLRARSSLALQSLRCTLLLSRPTLSMPVSTRSLAGASILLVDGTSLEIKDRRRVVTRNLASSRDGDVSRSEPRGGVEITPETPRKKRSTRVVTPTKSNDDAPTDAAAVTPSTVLNRKRKDLYDDTTGTMVTPPKPKSVKKTTVAVAKSPPAEWLSIYSLVQELRRDRTAPCDHSGCEALAAEEAHGAISSTTTPIDTNGTPTTPTFRFQVLISLMLSSQTKDAVVGAAIRAMKADGVLTIQAIAQMEPDVLKKYIEKVGFYNNKTKYIKETVEILMDKYQSDIPRTAAEMIRDLPGVGPKMAYICEGAAWNTYTGIGVDTHMHRVFNLLQWVKTTNPEQTRVQLESWLPVEYWADVNLLWVGFGQELQQEKPKLLRKALECSRPDEALRLLKRCKFDCRKVAQECGIELEIATTAGSSIEKD